MSQSQFKAKSKRIPIYKGDPNVFDVEHILRQRKNGETTEYFVKWLGYPDAENSWVDESDITQDLIDEFLKESVPEQESPATFDTQREAESPPATNSESVLEEHQDSYFEENLQNLGCNVLLQSPTDDLRLFLSTTGQSHCPNESIQNQSTDLSTGNP